MALPILGVAARLLASKGSREAIKKYGTKAVDAAKKEIAKRSAAIDKAAKSTNDKALGTYRRTRSKASTELRTANKPPSSRVRTRLKKDSPIGIEGGRVRGSQGAPLKAIKKDVSKARKPKKKVK